MLLSFRTVRDTASLLHNAELQRAREMLETLRSSAVVALVLIWDDIGVWNDSDIWDE